MKRQCFRHIASTLLALVLFASSMAIPSEVDAGVTAKSVIKKAIAELEAAESVGGHWDSVRSGYEGKDKNNVFYWHTTGMFVSDDDTMYDIWLDLEQNGNGYQEYYSNGKCFRKAYYELGWLAYNKPDAGTEKQRLSFWLKKVQKPKLETTKNSYIISGKLRKEDSGFKTVEMKIDKKTNRLTDVTLTMRKYTENYINSDDTYTVTSGKLKYSYISYGDSKVELPEELKGL